MCDPAIPDRRANGRTTRAFGWVLNFGLKGYYLGKVFGFLWKTGEILGIFAENWRIFLKFAIIGRKFAGLRNLISRGGG